MSQEPVPVRSPSVLSVPVPSPPVPSSPVQPSPVQSPENTCPARDHGADIRPLMASFPSGVGVITAYAEDGSPWGMTCTSLCGVSLDPPVVLVCLGTASHTLKAVRSSGSFAVNLLHAQGRRTAELFASGAPDRFDRVIWRGGAGTAGPHLTEDARAVADCSVVGEQVVGDHAVVLGEVTAVRTVPRQPPLLYGLRRFSAWPHAGEAAQPYHGVVG
ncbi:flavin reductase family protein [Streptomyces sp. NPDC127033]|uniref:flavin reductase family protein n=1 Tax=Streptomyces sp. NPDC127033 TaxID=3347110 RepID=UPI003653F806